LVEGAVPLLRIPSLLLLGEAEEESESVAEFRREGKRRGIGKERL
jgi:hypothetical protein